jgi:hypothetical protein
MLSFYLSILSYKIHVHINLLGGYDSEDSYILLEQIREKRDCKEMLKLINIADF